MDGLAAQVKIHPRITCLHNHSAIDLLTTHHHAKNSQYRYSVTNRCLGAYVLNAETGEPETILADWTVLATGGVGQVFLHSTNAPGCVGAGISMAFRAGVELANLEFMQFHPTALYEERSYRRPLITEAMPVCWTTAARPSCSATTSAATWPPVTWWPRPWWKRCCAGACPACTSM